MFFFVVVVVAVDFLGVPLFFFFGRPSDLHSPANAGFASFVVFLVLHLLLLLLLLFLRYPRNVPSLSLFLFPFFFIIDATR